MDQPLPVDEVDRMITEFRAELERLQELAVNTRHQFDDLHNQWLAYVEARNRKTTR